MNRILTCTIAFMLSAFSVQGQEILRGQVLDAQNQTTVPGAHIYIGNKLVGVSDPQGYFKLGDVSPKNQLAVTAIGYKRFTHILTKEHLDGRLFVVKMQSSDIGLDEFVVTATRNEQRISEIPGRIELIGAERLSFAAAPSADEVISTLPGVHSGRSFGLFSHRATVSMRGVSGKEQARTLVLLDGVPMNKADGGSVNWNLFSTGDIERIEVVKGPGSALYGGNAMGGVINIVRRKPRKSLEGYVAASGGTYFTRGFRGNLGGRKGAFYWQASGLWRASDGYITQSDADRQANPHIIKSDFHEKMATLRAGYSRSEKFEAEVVFSAFDDTRGTGEKVYQPEGNTTDHDTYSVHASFKGRFGLASWNSVVFFNREDYKRVSEWFKDDYTWYDVRSARLDYGVLTGIHRQTGRHLLSVGIDLRMGEVDAADVYFTSTDQVDNFGKNSFYGVYAQDQIRFFDSTVVLVAGLRYDYATFYEGGFRIHDPSAETKFMRSYEFSGLPAQSCGALSPRISLQYKPGDRFRLYAAYGRGFRPAVLDDLCRSGRVRGGFKVANPKLLPEFLNSFETGVDFRPTEKLRLSASLYASSGSDFLYYVSTGDSIDMGFGNRPVMIRANISSVRMYGLETDFMLTVSPALLIFGNYAFNVSEITNFEAQAMTDGADLKGKFLTDVPFHAANMGLQLRTPYVDAGVLARFTGAMYVSDQNITDEIVGSKTFPDVFTVDLKLSRLFASRYSVSLSVQNVFDRKIYESKGAVGPGRFIMLEAGVALGRM